MTPPFTPIRGIYTALATPFLADGEIDWKGFEALLQRQLDGRVDGVVLSGTTGESPTLSVGEKLSLVRKARALVENRIKIMAGTGGNCTNQSVELSRLAIDAGADSLLIVTPPYSKPSLAGLALHYEAIARATNAPLCLYHVPSRTGQLLTAAQIVELTKIPGVVSVKEASADMGLFSRARAASSATFLTGDDCTYLPSLAVGGSGIISVATNIFPAAFVALGTAFSRGDTQRAQALHDVLLPFVDALFCESNPGPLKAVLAHEGLCANVLRAPLAPVTAESAKKAVTSFEDTRQKLRELA